MRKFITEQVPQREKRPFSSGFLEMPPAGWSEEDLIRWVEGHAIEQGNPRLRWSTRPPAHSLNIWLARKRDKLTWGQIARKFFPRNYQPGGGKKWASNPAIGRARYAYNAVEKFLTPEAASRRLEKEGAVKKKSRHSHQSNFRRLGGVLPKGYAASSPQIREMGYTMERKYQELYTAMKKQEAQGRRWCRMYAPILAILISVLAIFVVSLLWLAFKEGEPGPVPVFVLAVLVLGLWTFAKAYAYGMRITLEAQRTLVLVDTEQNTAEIAALLLHEKEPESPGEPRSPTEPGEPSKTPPHHW